MGKILEAECYEEMKGLVFGLAYRFWKKYRGDLKVIQSEALFHYVTAYWSYKPEKGTFKRWVTIVVWGNLLSDKEKEASDAVKRGKRVPEEELEEEVSQFNLSRFLHDLPDDAREVAKVALDPPPEIRVDKFKGVVIRNRIREYFLREYGWTPERVTRSFQAISNALEE